MNTEEERYIARCIQLAKNGQCYVSPNPMVGAVIVHNGKIIGEGYHVRHGEAHAELNAINSVKDQSLLKNATIYVNLEPCSHYGKTPPCADLIIKKQIPRVVIGCLDPFSKVAGKGAQKLRDVGIEVTVGVLENECKDLNKKFVTSQTRQRPYILLKWAESADGYIDIHRVNGKPTILSTPLTSMLAHKKRAEVDGIMVGTNTALLDNPSLNVRNWYGKSPVRIILDKCLRLPKELQLFSSTDNIKTLCFTSKVCPINKNTEYIKIDYESNILPQIMNILHERGIQSILVEGGNILLQSFIDQSLWDEAHIEKSPIILHEGVRAPKFSETEKLHEEHFFDTSLQHCIHKRIHQQKQTLVP